MKNTSHPILLGVLLASILAAPAFAANDTKKAAVAASAPASAKAPGKAAVKKQAAASAAAQRKALVECDPGTKCNKIVPLDPKPPKN